jgi:hypothetical protein
MIDGEFHVVVRNELTDEEATVLITSACPEDAQVEALVQVFESLGWKNIHALAPTPVHLPNGAEKLFVEVGSARFETE